MSTESFYSNLPPFSEFDSLSEDRHYQPLPIDWFIVITDVRGSTKVIESGRYEDVNMLGAASVAILGELWRDNAVPFVFGGDGASILVPPERLETVKLELIRLRNLALVNYKLELRVGVVPMTEVLTNGLRVEVAKFALSPAKPIAFIRGGGLAWADQMIKTEPDRYCFHDDSAGILGAVKDLSCRWQPLKSRNGKILTLLARSTNEDAGIYTEVLENLNKILGGDVQTSSPVHQLNMKYKSMASIIRSESRAYMPLVQKKFLAQLILIAMCIWEFRFSWTFSLFDGKTYAKKIPQHSDYRKFDDMLRLVIDCKAEQIEKIQKLFETLHRSGRIYYGLHIADHAIMTCLVGSLTDGDHIHFIDGGDGGYAFAARSLKEQISLANAKGAAV